MLNEEQWQRYEKLVFSIREFSHEDKRLLFTETSMADLILILSNQILKTRDEEPVLANWEAAIEPFLIQLHDEALRQNPTVEFHGNVFCVVSEGVAEAMRGWMNDNCPRGVD